MSKFIAITVVSYTPEKRSQPAPDNPDGFVMAPAKHNMFEMYVKPEHVAGTNAVDEAPVASVKSIVYFSAESGMKPVLTTETVEKIVVKVERALDL